MAGNLALLVFKTIVGAAGILGNGLVCAVIAGVAPLRTRTNAFIFQQAVVDLLGSLVLLLQSTVPPPPRLTGDPAGWFLCYVWLSDNLLFFLFVTSTLNLLAVTLERYLAIVHPFRYQAAFASYPRLKVGAILAACWVLSAAIKSYNMTIYAVRDGQCVSVPGSGPAPALLIALLQYALPVAVMCFAYLRTGAELKRGAARAGPGAGQPGAGMAESLLRARRNTFRTLLLVFATFVVCWTPNQLLFFLFNLGFPIGHDDWYVLVTVALVAANACANPVIYAFKYRQFRRGARRLFCGRCLPPRGEVSVIESTLASHSAP